MSPGKRWLFCVLIGVVGCQRGAEEPPCKENQDTASKIWCDPSKSFDPLPLDDSVPVANTGGMLTAELNIGSANQRMRVMLDTGSSTLALNDPTCATCEDCYCAYDAGSSTTYEPIAAGSARCPAPAECEGQCGSTGWQGSDECGFCVHYESDAGLEGSWGVDEVTFGARKAAVQFGRIRELVGGQDNSGLQGRADGILGLGGQQQNNVLNDCGVHPPSPMEALGGTGMLPFSLCFGPEEGVLTLGEVSDPSALPYAKPGSVIALPIADTAPAAEGLYGIELTGISVGGALLGGGEIDFGAGGPIVDSGSTDLLLPEAMFDDLKTKVCDAEIDTGLRQVLCEERGLFDQSEPDPVCKDLSGFPTAGLPNVEFTFAGVAEDVAGVALPFETFLVESTGRPGDACAQGLTSLAIGSESDSSATNEVIECDEVSCASPSAPGVVFGDSFMIHFAWYFDLAGGTIAFGERCGCFGGDDPC